MALDKSGNFTMTSTDLSSSCPSTDGTVVPVPRLAASLILIRDGAEGLEVFLMRRSEHLSFAPGYYAFPGGVLDVEDKKFSQDGLHTLKATAIRETFEESGYGLFIGQESSLDMDELKHSSGWPRLNFSQGGYYHWLRSKGLRPDCEALHLLSCWITPVVIPKRYETYFFVARVPSNQFGDFDGSEMVAMDWASLHKGLKGGSFNGKLMFPTEMNLSWIEKFSRVEQVFSALESHRAPVITPEIVEEADGSYAIIPEDSGYEICRRKL